MLRLGIPNVECVRELQHRRNTGEPSVIKPERLKSVFIFRSCAARFRLNNSFRLSIVEPAYVFAPAEFRPG
ncbi:hypothetical protein PC116_g24800 [Phytophthora cactorum]|nr:hypothetical protein PC116_g24800 [Phytophthora cactorum]